MKISIKNIAVTSLMVASTAIATGVVVNVMPQSNHSTIGLIGKNDSATISIPNSNGGYDRFVTMPDASEWKFIPGVNSMDMFIIFEPGAVFKGSIPSESDNSSGIAPDYTGFTYNLHYANDPRNGANADQYFMVGGDKNLYLTNLMDAILHNNLYDQTNDFWRFDRISVKLVSFINPNDTLTITGNNLNADKSQDLWTSSSLAIPKTVTYSPADTTDKIFINKPIKSDNIIIDDSAVPSGQKGIKYEYGFSDTNTPYNINNWYSKADMMNEIKKNLWDESKSFWKYKSIWVRINAIDNNWSLVHYNGSSEYKQIWSYLVDDTIVSIRDSFKESDFTFAGKDGLGIPTLNKKLSSPLFVEYKDANGNWSTTKPTNLKNGGALEVRLNAPTKGPDKYTFDQTPKTITVSGLNVSLSDAFSINDFTFSGTNGSGTPTLNKKLSTPLFVEYKDTNGNWSTTKPTNLKNGDTFEARLNVSAANANKYTFDQTPEIISVSNLNDDLKVSEWKKDATIIASVIAAVLFLVSALVFSKRTEK